MSIVNTLGNMYYQLFNQTDSSGAGDTSGSNGTGTLLSALTANSNAAQGYSFDSAYHLDLSPEAQKYVTGAANLNDSNSHFMLTTVQRQTISDILAKYQDAPFTQDTFNKIQDDLTEAGLSPDKLAMLDKMKSFNATAILISNLSGNYAAADAAANPDEKTKSGNFMQQIISQWKNLTSKDAVQSADATSDA